MDQNITSIALELLAKSGLILLVAAALCSSLRGLSAAQRHVIWLAAFAALLLLPLTKSIAPRWHLPGSPSTRVVVTLPLLPAPSATSAPATETRTPSPKEASHWPDARELAVGLWLTGMLALITYRLLGDLQVARLVRHSVAAESPSITRLARQAATEMGLLRTCNMRLAEAVRVPCTWGARRPVVVLPAEAEEWPEDQLLAALRHELAHVSRRDYLVRWAVWLVCSLYWLNPLAWFAARRLRAEQEQACDDLVLRAGSPSPDYAALLVAMARASMQGHRELQTAVAMARPSSLEGRVLAVVDEARNRRPAGPFTRSLAGTGLAAIVATSALAQVAPQKPASPPAVEAQVLISSKFVEAPAGILRPPRTAGAGPKVLSNLDAANLVEKVDTSREATILSAPRITMRSGQSGRVQLGRDHDVPGGGKRFIGGALEVTPTINDNIVHVEGEIRWSALSEAATIATDHPVYTEQTATVAKGISAQQTIAVEMGPIGRDGRELYVLIQAHKVEPNETPLAAATPSPLRSGTFTLSGQNTLTFGDGLTFSGDNKAVSPGATVVVSSGTGTLDLENGTGVLNLANQPSVSVSAGTIRVAPNAGEKAPPAQTIIGLKGDGTLTWNGETLAAADLSTRLKALVERSPDASVILRGDEHVAYAEITKVLDACSAAKVWNVGLVAAKDIPAPAVADLGTREKASVTADHAQMQFGVGTYTGNVVMQRGPRTIRADWMEYDTAQQRAKFVGHVRIEEGQNVIESEQLEVDFKPDGSLGLRGPHKTTINPSAK